MLPDVKDLSKWAVIACDQFTSQPDYWDNVKEIAGDSPSAYNLILPEALLNESDDTKILQINSAMDDYLRKELFKLYRNSYIYVERKLLDGSTRRGVVGVIDLEEYDYKPDSTSLIRATEGTVKERIPPRKKVRENAPIELSHVILLCDDEKKNLIEPLTISKHSMRKLYDFDLMLGGGNIKGWLVNGDHARAFNTRMSAYIKRKRQELSLVFAVGDGNHSLAAAKACYESINDRMHPSRYAMVELENLHDDAIKFEPIHRLVKNINPDEFIDSIKREICTENIKDSWPINFYCANKSGVIHINKNLGASALIVLQKFLDEENLLIDYIHDLEALKNLSSEANNIGFELPKFDEAAKREFFRVISENGVLPRKTFSMGHAQEKRYYLEARRIK